MMAKVRGLSRKGNMISAQIQGGAGALSRLFGFLRRSKAQRFEATVREVTEEIFQESQRLVPVDTGALKRSGKYEVQGKGFSASGVISYDTHYAVYVHEDLTKHHAPPTQAKFITQPMYEYAPRLAAKLKAL